MEVNDRNDEQLKSDINKFNIFIDDVNVKIGEVELKVSELKQQIIVGESAVRTSTAIIEGQRAITDIVCNVCTPKVNDVLNLDEHHNIIKVATKSNIDMKVECDGLTVKLTEHITRLNRLVTDRDKMVECSKQREADRQQCEADRKIAQMEKEKKKILEDTKAAYEAQEAKALEQRKIDMAKIQDAQKQAEIERVNAEIERKKAELERKKQELRNNIEKADIRFNNLKAHTIKSKALVAQLKKDYKYTQTKVSPYLELRDETKLKITKDNEILVGKYQHKAYYKIAMEMCGDSGVKKRIVEDVVDVLNNRIQRYLTRMGTDYMYAFDNSFEPIFLTERGECSYNNFSTGERCRINFSYMLSYMIINSVLGKFNSSVVNIDELLDAALDDKGIESIIPILREFVEHGEKKQINIISHRQLDSAGTFDNMTKIEKNKGISTIDVKPC